MPEDQRRAGAAPEGIRAGLFLSRSHLRDLRTLPDRGGAVQHTRRRPQRAGPCGKGRSRGRPPEEPTKGVVTPPSFFAAPQGVGVYAYALRPPEARPSRRMARGVPKGQNRRFDPSQLPPKRRAGGGGAGHTGRMPRAFSLRKSGTDPRKSEVVGVPGLGNPAQTAWPHSCSCMPLAILALRAL